MSKPGGKRGAAKAAVSAKTATVPAASDEATTAERATPATSKSASGDIDLKDDGSNNGDKKDKTGAADDAPAPKPQSAGATVRDAAQKLLGLTMRQEWTPVEQVIKNMEKAVASSNDDMNLSPLAGVLDPVSVFFGLNDHY